MLITLASKVAKHALVVKAFHIADTAFAVSSMCIVPAAMAISVFWYTQKPTLNNLDRRSVTTLDVPAGATAKLADPFHLTADTSMAVYHVTLVDAYGDTAYVYPDVRVKDPQHMDLGAQSVRIPSSLAPGTYSVSVDVQYKLNPIKTANVRIQLARILVTSSPSPQVTEVQRNE